MLRDLSIGRCVSHGAAILNSKENHKRQIVKDFRKKDKTNDGHLSEDVFRSVCHKVGIPLKPADLKALMERYSVDGKNVNYQEVSGLAPWLRCLRSRSTPLG